MRDFAIVTKIEGQTIEAVSLISNACINCEDSLCAKQGKTFMAINKKNLPVQENSVVRIEVSRISRGIQGVFSLLFPILSAVAGYIFAPEISIKYGVELTENFMALCVAAAFSVSSLLVLIISRSSLHFSLPEITQVL